MPSGMGLGKVPGEGSVEQLVDHEEKLTHDACWHAPHALMTPSHEAVYDCVTLA